MHQHSASESLPVKETFVIGFALFAMFFGAGNLIFPVMVGAQAGTNVLSVTLGLLLTSVALPVCGMIVAATETPEEADRGGVPARIGKIPGAFFTLVVFLTTGMLYAVPRVVTVAYEMSAAPLLTDLKLDDGVKLFVFTVIFFALTVFFVLSPSSVVNRVGKYLSPALLIFLALLVAAAFFTMPNLSGAPGEKWANTPFISGIIEGYNTMDALATFVFGVVIVHSLKENGANTSRRRIRDMLKVSCIAGACLAIVYIGLTVVGTRQAGMGFKNGADLLATVAGQVFGPVGQLIFSTIAILACLTTAIGLLTSATEYYKNLLPRVSYAGLLAVQVLISVSLANLGLDRILAIVAPLMQFVYPVAITIIALALLECILPFRLVWAYKISAAIAALLSFLEALRMGFSATAAYISPLLDLLPLSHLQMAWLLPALCTALICIIYDGVSQSRRSTAIASSGQETRH